ncbi:S-layer homology domain-containing protein [Paenibacillus xerothermodurans]|nr:S-layer homology domain-containing protein [Paenibacillus xerothermodurans]
MLKKKVVISTLSASLLCTGLLPVGLPTDDVSGRVYAETAAALPSDITDRMRKIRDAMTPEERQRITDAQDRADEIRKDLTKHKDLVTEIWNKVDAKLKQTADPNLELTQEDILFFVLAFSVQYDPNGKSMEEVLGEERAREIAEKLIKLGGFPGGLEDVAINDVSQLINKGQSNMIERFRQMPMNELLGIVANPDRAETILVQEIDKLINDPGLAFGKVLKNINVTGTDVVAVFKRLIPKFDPQRRAMAAWVTALIRVEGLGAGTPDKPRRRGGSGGVFNPPANAGIYTGSLPVEAVKLSKGTMDGKSVTFADVDEAQLKAYLDSIISGQADKLIQLAFSETEPTLKLRLPAAALTAAVQSGAVFHSTVHGLSFTVPISIFAGLDLSAGSTVVITLSQVTDAVKQQVQQSADQVDADVVASPAEFSVSMQDENGNSTVVGSYKGSYLQRGLPVTGQIDPNKATGVWFNEGTGKLSFIPATFGTRSAGSTVGTLHSPHDSIYTIVQSDKTFKDIAGHWAKTDVETMASKLIVDGVAPDEFAPDSPLTRAQFVALLVRSLALVEQPYQAGFSDVDSTDWHSTAIQTAVTAGLIEGFEDGTFRPDDSVTREQLAVLISRALKAAGGDTPTTAAGALERFADRDTISPWAENSVQQTVQIGLFNGQSDNSFAPQGDTTRAQGAVTLKRLLQYLKFMN